ncbi:RHS repeat-associated core domain-containing protein [Amycolatopsis sp. NPDC051061]|uniref:RHS repeat-associated core domain-containing protein n=1 Tax=Amycolatopsis sp. NPDC051061 TaxID=3155042 RepID=UPI00343FDC1D
MSFGTSLSRLQCMAKGLLLASAPETLRVWGNFAMSNPLVAPVKDSTTAVSGVPLLEDATSLKSAIESGDWASVAVGAVGTALDALTAVLDPFGAVFAAGVGWLIEHVGPLKEALDALAGNVDEITAQSQTWTNVAKELEGVSTELVDLVKKDLGVWTGTAADAYRERAEDTSILIASAQKGCEGAASGVKTAGEVVAAVRTLVRDVIADLVGHLISWALQVVFTLGIGMTWVVPQVVAAVAKTASKIAGLTTKLVKALKGLVPLLKKAGTLFEDAGKALKNIKPGNVKPAGKPKDITARSSPEPNPGGKGGDSTTAAGDHGGGGNTHTSGDHGGDHKPPAKHDPPENESSRSGPDGHTSTSGSSGGNGKSGTGDAGRPRGNPGDGERGGGLRGHNNEPVSNSTPSGCRPGSGDPIDMTTGRMMLAQTDVEIDGLLPLLLERAHFSGYRSGVHFGAAWASTVDQRIEVSDDRVDFAAEDGTLLVFPPPGEDRVLPVNGPGWWLSGSDAEFRLDQPDLERTLHFVRQSGGVRWLSAVSDRSGNLITFERNSEGVPTGIRHSAGHRLTVASAGGRITDLASAEGGLLVRFGYDKQARLISVVNSSGLAYRFDYDEASRITAWLDRNGWGYKFDYDDHDRCVRGAGPGGALDYTFAYDPQNRVNRATDSLGHTTTYELTDDFRLARQIDPLGGVVEFAWDACDRLLARTDQLGRVTRYGYDESGLLVSETRPDGSGREIRRDEHGRIVTRMEPDGAVTSYGYDEAGRLASVTDPLGGVRRRFYDDTGRLAAVVDEEGRRTEITCDELGKPLLLKDPAGGVTRYSYDPLGNLAAETDPLGAVTRYEWTAEGELWRRISPDGSTVRYSYDGELNAREEIDGTGAVTRTDYGPFDLPVCEIAPDGSRVRFAYDTEMRLTSVVNEAGAEWRIGYDAAGHVVRETDFDGCTVSYVRDAAGQPVEIHNGGLVTHSSFDQLGRLVRKHTGDAITSYTYDPADRLVRARNGETDLTLSYDRLGRVVAESCDGREIRSVLDRTGLRTGRRTPSGTESAWTYDAAGAPARLRTARRTIEFARDRAGRETGRTLGAARLAQTWDVNGRLAGQALTIGSEVLAQRRAYSYRADDVLTGIDDLRAGRVDFDPDRLGRITAVRGQSRTEHYGYDRVGNVQAAEWGAHPAVGQRTFDGGLLTRAGAAGYEYDERNRVIRRGGMRFTWNADDHLVRVDASGDGHWSYTYDALGRRRTKRFVSSAGVALQETVFVWDGMLLAEESTRELDGRVVTTVWEWLPGEVTPVSRLLRPGAADEQFHAVVADVVGSPVELVDEDGRIAWKADWSLWGVGQSEGDGMPLRFPGQYFDAETGLHYNLYRYYEPETGRYLSPDPLGLGGGLKQHAYVANPTGWLDPAGLAAAKCKGGKAHNPTLNTNATNGKKVGQSYFSGGADTPVTRINDKRFVGLLENLAKGRGEEARRAQELLRQMQEKGWQQTAGIHHGGLGGAAGGADPRSHITVNVGKKGYHVHVGESHGKLFGQDITPDPFR